MKTIYIGEIVYSEIGTDDKWRIKTMVQAYARLEDAKAYVDSGVEIFQGMKTRKYKCGKVWTIEEVRE